MHYEKINPNFLGVYMRKISLFVFVILLLNWGCSDEKQEELIYKTLSREEVGSTLKQKGFFSKEYNFNKTFCNPNGDFQNDYQAKTINGDQFVIDRATGLMWHQSGSAEYLTFKDAKQWIDDLNKHGYARYSDWRLPSLEEGASLLESSQKNGKLYIDPVFSKKQEWIWTGDKYSFASGGVWVVFFDGGMVDYSSIGTRSYGYVRPVRVEQ